MDELFETRKEKKGVNLVFIGGIVVALAIVAGAIWMLSLRPSFEDQTAKFLEGAFREGSPEYASINKDILISKDDNTVESPTGMGTISMFIKGNILNRSKKTITALEVNVSVINQQNQPIREKNVVVVPVQQPVLTPGQSIPITVNLAGFDRKDDRANINFKVTAVKTEN